MRIYPGHVNAHLIGPRGYAALTLTYPMKPVALELRIALLDHHHGLSAMENGPKCLQDERDFP